MRRRTFVAGAGTAALTASAAERPTVPMKFGIDLFSIRSSGFNAFEYLDYCAKWKAKVVHFSEIRFLGNLEPEHLKKVRAHAAKLGIELEIGMRSICPSSKAFDPNQGTAEEQLGRMIDAAKAIGAKLVRAFLGTSADRTGDIPIEGHIENTAKVLRNVRSRVVDAGLKVAVENHAGDMQARELKMLIEAAGKDFTGACIDSGNPLWTIEDPHLTLEVLAPYVLTSHVRDSHVYRTPEGAAVHWVRLGEGNVDIVGWMRKFGEVCAGKAMSLETLVTGPRMYPYLQPGFWGPYRKTPAWEFARFVSLVEKGTPIPKAAPAPKEQAAQREREDLEACIRYWQQVFGA